MEDDLPAGDDDEPTWSAEAEITLLIRRLNPLGPWVDDAACAGMGEVFTSDWPPAPDLASVMERVCRRCPVRAACADFAASTSVRGYWAGIWRASDSALRQRERRPAA